MYLAPPVNDIAHQMQAGASKADSVTAPHVAIGPTVDTLFQVKKPPINLAIWQRDVSPVIAAWLWNHKLPKAKEDRPDIDFQAPVDIIPRHLAMTLNPDGRYPSDAVTLLSEDIGLLAATMAELTGAARLRVRLEWITGNACSYFHVDQLPYRMVTTYWGAGTQYVSNRVAATLERPESVPNPPDILSLAPGHVGVMRGSALGDVTCVALKHRSPPVTRPSHWRLFLAIDAA